MYKFAYYFIYKYQLIDNKGAVGISRYMASILVSLAIYLHLALVCITIRFIVVRQNHTNIVFLVPKAITLLVVLGIMAPLFICVFRYFNQERILAISQYYDERQPNMYAPLNFVKFLLIYLIPLLCIPYLLNHAVPA
jgi:hypothetical protein